ncbi:transcriptional coactivator p15/PC4 family protein [Candidatus Micrarchaeota archaeon]|jgi:hypothetical protein|nr:transcriptional coactivator p15/PC4 family protein [Candidatus Micrarchaeota archaeon]
MDKEIGRIKKNDSTEIVVKVDDFGGTPGVTIREFVTTDTYKGFTKAGTRITKENWDSFVKLVQNVSFE